MRYLSILLFLTIPLSSYANDQRWEYLLDSDLVKWELWMGVPHSSVKGLPEDTFISNLIIRADLGKPMGLNNDPKNVFSVVSSKGGNTLAVTGEIFGGLTTLESYKDYHLNMQVKWGEKKWQPSLDDPRNAGLLFHCRGDHGVTWLTWKSCLELEIMEGKFGDFIPMAGTSAKIRTTTPDISIAQYDPSGEAYSTRLLYGKAIKNNEAPHGKWNQIDLYTVGTSAIFVVNDSVALIIKDAKDKYGNPLSNGQIQLQSEGAEVYYRDIKIRPISEFPKSISTHIVAGSDVNFIGQ